MAINPVQLKAVGAKTDPMERVLQGLQIANEIFKVPVGYNQIGKSGAEAAIAGRKAAGISTRGELADSGNAIIPEEKVTPQTQLIPYAPNVIPYAPKVPTEDRPLLPATYYGPKPAARQVQGDDGEIETVFTENLEEKNKFFDDESNLRKEFTNHPITQNTNEIMMAGERALDIFARPGAKFGADDLALINAFSKINDPRTGVKEGELDLARKSQGLKNELGAMIAGLTSGEVLTPAGRNNMERTIRGLIDTQLELQSRVDAKYGARADDRGFRRDAITGGVWSDSQGNYSDDSPEPMAMPARKLTPTKEARYKELKGKEKAK